MKIETRAVHAGRHIDPATGAVTPPIHLSTTFERGPDGEYPRGYSYSREDNPNRRALEECLASLEGGKQALCFSSGLAVATALVQGLEPGDHIIAPDDVYWGLRKVIGEVFGKWGLETTYVDMTSIDDFHAALRPNTRLVWVETPSNPLMKVTDLAAIAALARLSGPNILTVCDGTFATPVLQQPLDCGIDMVAHSTTKYIGGHSDVIGGALITRHDNYLFERARKSQRYGGSVPSPFDCWLTLRGVDTLPWRVRAQSENAHARGAIPGTAHAPWRRCTIPASPAIPGTRSPRARCRRSAACSPSRCAASREAALAVAARCKLFIRATSLGGAHSLIEHRASIEGPNTRTPQNLLRLSIGLEHTDDLIADLEQALSTIPA